MKLKINKRMRAAFVASGIISIVLAVIFVGSFMTYSIIGTPSNYQGPNIYFIGYSELHDGKKYWIQVYDTGVAGKIAAPNDCQFYAHMSPIFLKPDKDVQKLYSLADQISKDIKEGTNGAGISIPPGDVAPEHTYLLKVTYYNSTSGNTKTTKVIALYEFPAEAFLWFYASAQPGGIFAPGQNVKNNYDIWIKISLNGMYQNWYWSWNGTPAREVFFSLGEIIPEVEANSIYSSLYVNPGTNQPLMMYFQPNGTPISSKEQEEHIFSMFKYSGGVLNPAAFPKAVYIHIDLQNFGTQFTNWVHTAWAGDGVVIVLHFHVFVIGEWIVQNVMNLKPPKPPEPHGGWNFALPGLSGLFGYFLSFGLGGLVALALIIALVVTCPELIVMGIGVMSSFKSMRGGRKK